MAKQTLADVTNWIATGAEYNLPNRILRAAIAHGVKPIGPRDFPHYGTFINPDLYAGRPASAE